MVSAQNRQRYYWANWNIEQPKDKGILLKDVIQHEVNAEFNLTNESETKQGKSYYLTASQGNCVAWNSIQRKQRTMIPVCNSNDENPNVYNNVLYRKLTPIECERLQTFPDNWTDCVSNSQRYKQMGNSWTVDVISHIFNQMKD